MYEAPFQRKFPPKTTATRHCALVIGVGSPSGIGGAVARRFSAEGLHVFVVGRTQTKLDAVVSDIQAAGGSATSVINQLRDENEIHALFAQVAAENMPLDAVIYNAAFVNTPHRFMTTSPEFVEANWRLTCLAGFMVGKAALQHMRPQAHGTLIYTGATASLRGKPLFAAFASAKAALRSFAQSFANEGAPMGIHVAHVVIDGGVAGDRLKTAFHGLGRLMLAAKGEQGGLLPEKIADNYWQIHAQQRGAWTHELDLRPFKESF